MLAISRAVGETMIVLLAAGSTPNLTFNPVESIQAMTAYIGVTATGDIATGTIDYKTIFAVGTVLFVMTLVMNMISIRLVRQVPRGLRVMAGAERPQTERTRLAVAGARATTRRDAQRPAARAT